MALIAARLSRLKAPKLEENDRKCAKGIEPLVLWRPDENSPPGSQAVEVDGRVLQYLRPHQREGVQFMFECVTGLREYGGKGCILADDMGLGKTLQCISLIWTMLNHTMGTGSPLARRVVICCPTSLVGVL